MASCYDNGDVYAIELVDSSPGKIKDIKIEELNFGSEESTEQTNAA